jgi:vitamin B12 transporter
MKQHIILMISILVLCGVLPCRQGAAEEREDRSDFYTLGEVVISGKEEGVETTETVRTVTAEDIRNKGARTLDQALALLPGVNIRVGGDGVPRIDIRGFRTRHVVLLLNGIPMNSAIDQQFDPTVIPTENIAEIKLTEGASSVLYGQGGLGGVINIITKKGTKGVQGMILGETGDHEPYLVRSSVAGGKDKIDYFFSGSFAKVNSFPLSGDFHPTSEQPGGYRNNSDRERNTVFGNVGFSPNKDLTIGLSFNLTQGGYGKPASAINDPFDPFAAPPKYERIDDFFGFSTQLAVDYQVTSQLSLRGWAFTNQLKEHDNMFDNSSFNTFNLATGSFQEHVQTAISGGTLQPKLELGKAGTVTFSIAAEWDSWENHGIQTTAPNTFGPLDLSKSLSIFSTGAEYEISPLPGLGLAAGYGHYWQVRDETNEDDYSLLAGASYDVTANTRIKGSFKRNIRFPSLGDLYDLTQGNPNLATERAYTCEGGAEQKLPQNSSMSLTGFYTVAKNLIQNDQVTNRNTNLAEVRFTGFEIAAKTQFVKQLLLRASYAFLDSQDKSRAGRDQQQYTPGNKATLEGKYDFACGFTPYASLLYVGNQYFYTKNNVTPMQKAKLSDYTLVNAKLSQRLVNNKITIYVGVDNMLDENYETSYGFPQAGRFVYGGVEFRL